jgi:hypothetical protein
MTAPAYCMGKGENCVRGKVAIEGRYITILVMFVKPHCCCAYMSFAPSVYSSRKNPPHDFTVMMSRLK